MTRRIKYLKLIVLLYPIDLCCSLITVHYIIYKPYSCTRMPSKLLAIIKVTRLSRSSTERYEHFHCRLKRYLPVHCIRKRLPRIYLFRRHSYAYAAVAEMSSENICSVRNAKRNFTGTVRLQAFLVLTSLQLTNYYYYHKSSVPGSKVYDVDITNDCNLIFKYRIQRL